MSSPDPKLNASGKHEAVRKMFAEIAPTYDRLNHLLSGNIDKRWRKFTVKQVSETLSRPDAAVLDLCCGTGDLTFELANAAPQANIIGCDFCLPMVALAPAKSDTVKPLFMGGDALNLPFAEQSFDLVTNAFGLRNLESVERGLAEIFRILKPGGQVAILEFSHPTNPVLDQAFGFYFTKILPRIGALVSGSNHAYTYLPNSVSYFPNQKHLAEIMQSIGFREVRFHNLFAGIAALHIGTR
jgi:demethylmenaquinone methyltransferase / 2-methoxy-6-polyprenyl-1,4-benzoquinol methylase